MTELIDFDASTGFSKPEPVVKGADEPKSIHREPHERKDAGNSNSRRVAARRKRSGALGLQFLRRPVLSRVELMAPLATQRSRRIELQ
jgi:hypothetical protein